MRDQYAIGATYESMQYLFQLRIKSPLAEFKPFSRAITNGSLSVVGQGFPTALWVWGVIGATERNTLKALCAGLSSQVWMRTYNDSIATPAWETYRARMLWTPEAEDRQNASRLKFTITFRLLEKIVVV